MTWTKLGDEFPAEARDLASDEFRLHVEALCWSNMRLLDLRVPKRDLRRLSELDDPEGAACGLGAKGWWEDCGDAWDIGVRFPEWQEERVVVDKWREDAALRKRRSRLHKAGDHSLCLPGGPCPHVTRDGTRDGTGDETRRPGRVGTGPTDRPDPKDQPPDQGQLQRHSAANSQKPRVHDGSKEVVDDAHNLGNAATRRTPATDRNARTRENGKPFNPAA